MTKSNTETILDDDAIAEIEARANAATEGPWASDNAQDSEHHYQYYMVIDPGSHVLFDTFNSASGEIHEEVDEDGVYRWDDVARRNIAFASHAREDIPALCQAVRALKAENEQLCADSAEIVERLIRCADRSGEWLVENGDLQFQLEQVTRERDELRDNMNRLARARAREIEGE